MSYKDIGKALKNNRHSDLTDILLTDILTIASFFDKSSYFVVSVVRVEFCRATESSCDWHLSCGVLKAAGQNLLCVCVC